MCPLGMLRGSQVLFVGVCACPQDRGNPIWCIWLSQKPWKLEAMLAQTEYVNPNFLLSLLMRFSKWVAIFEGFTAFSYSVSGHLKHKIPAELTFLIFPECSHSHQMTCYKLLLWMPLIFFRCSLYFVALPSCSTNSFHSSRHNASFRREIGKWFI